VSRHVSIAIDGPAANHNVFLLDTDNYQKLHMTKIHVIHAR